MANTKISQLTPNTNPSGGEELVYAYNNTNGKMTLNTMKGYVENNLSGYATDTDLSDGLAAKQDALVSGTNIKTINNQSLLGGGNLDMSGGITYTAGTGISVTSGVIANTGVTSVNGQTGAVTVSGGGGSSSYDAIVDASGGGDYTTIGAAVNAGKKNIFVRNGSYTESAQRDVHSAGNNTLHITGESYLGVNISVANTITITGSASRFIDMALPTGYTEFDFYMKNLNFTLDFSGNVSYFFRTGSSEGKFLVEDCGFVYSGGTSNNYLFYGNNIFDITTDSNSYNNTKCNMFNRCVFDCSTDAANGFVYVVSSGEIVAENCVFKTSGTGTMSIVGASSGSGYIKHCNIDAYGLYFNSSISILNSRIKIASGGSFYYHSSSTPNDFRCEFIENSDFIIDGNLGTAGAVIIGGICNNCTINISASNLTDFNIGGVLYENRRYCTNTRVNYTGTVDLDANAYGLGLTTSSLILSGNSLRTYSGIYMINGGTVSITASDSVIMGNLWNGATVTDSGTGNVVANNVA